METSLNQSAGIRRHVEDQEAAKGERYLTIGDMAREFGISLRALRFYEDRGLLHPRRRGTTRFYSSRDRLHLQLILKGKRLGFTLTEILDILARDDSSERLELKLRPDQIVAQISHLERQRDELEAALAELRLAQERTRDDGHLTAA